MIEVHEVNQIDALADFRSTWRELLAQTAAASFFQSLEWLECYWRHFGGDQKLRVLVASDCRQPVGILPLVVRPETTRVGRLRILTYPLHDWATFYGPIGPCATSTLTAGLRHVRATPRDWDVLDLRWIDAEGRDLGRTERAMAQAGCPSHRQKWDRTSLVELPETWQEYWLAREPKFRKNIDRLQRRMAEQGGVEFVRCRSVGQVANLSEKQQIGNLLHDPYETCVALAQRSWQGEGGDKTNLCHDQFGRFFREAHAAAAELGAAATSTCSISTASRPPSPTTTSSTAQSTV